MNDVPWTPWRKVVALRDDLRSGELSLNIFAADLYDVVMNSGPAVYRDPAQFFALTFLPWLCAIWRGMWCCGWQVRAIKLFANSS